MAEQYPRIYTVSDLTRQIKTRLENDFPLVWVSGEISNLRLPLSGHCYFTLKDEASQLRAVLFRGNHQFLRHKPCEGLKVVCRGRISVYEPRGEYQLLVDYLEPLGVGALAQAFEELKLRLDKEGLFDSAHKKPLPFLPQRLAVVTSPTGAAIRDFLQVLNRRFPSIEVMIYPVKVQGSEAAAEIVQALDKLNTLPDIDVLVLARGGGSLEDLWPFNEEAVARAIFRSRIPVLSAIGHEIDFTIADFVADVRAPTPSAAAELVVQRKEELDLNLQRLSAALKRRIQTLIQVRRERLFHLSQRLLDPRRRLADLRLRVDDRLEQLQRAWQGQLQGYKHRLQLAQAGLRLMSPRRAADAGRQLLEQRQAQLRLWLRQQLTDQRRQLQHYQERLQTLNPQAILERGYAVATILPTQEVVRDVQQVQVGASLRVRVARGSMDCEIQEINELNR
ncbi:MAG: exodeoxyribonuclease VII large subunit [Deltaproteobacteria bacterium]|nr:exodeoxyribonuclease VII large subunit [Deltaproteobacteria bacterium]MBW2135304.1 exodeoxyribonuclease VII large subunit [Deltaproteobacteria bacterium]